MRTLLLSFLLIFDERFQLIQIHNPNFIRESDSILIIKLIKKVLIFFEVNLTRHKLIEMETTLKAK